jgi:hypothetical protein
VGTAHLMSEIHEGTAAAELVVKFKAAAGQ